MKKLALFITLLLSAFTLTACLAGGVGEDVTVTIPNELPNEPITIEI